MDLYRLEHSSADDLGLEEYFDGQGVSVIEWPEFGADVLPKDVLTITIKRQSTSDEGRQFTLVAQGPRSEALLTQFKERWV